MAERGLKLCPTTVSFMLTEPFHRGRWSEGVGMLEPLRKGVGLDTDRGVVGEETAVEALERDAGVLRGRWVVLCDGVGRLDRRPRVVPKDVCDLVEVKLFCLPLLLPGGVDTPWSLLFRLIKMIEDAGELPGVSTVLLATDRSLDSIVETESRSC